MLQNSQENTCARVSVLIKLQASVGKGYLKLTNDRKYLEYLT